MASLRVFRAKLRSLFRVSFVKIVQVVLVFFAVFLVRSNGSAADDKSSPLSQIYFDQMYAEGVKAYTDQLWYKCAYNIEKSITEYKNFKKTLTDCRMSCKNHLDPEDLSELPTGLGDASMFEVLRHAHCFRRCKSDAYYHRPGLVLTKILENTFESRKPYQYLQYCWFKLDRLKLAASASYTFYLKNPEDEDVKRNIAYYRDKAKVPESDFLDLELVPYKEHYIRAMMAYAAEEWPVVVDNLEMAVGEFLVEEERCRADCEDSVEANSASHFSGTIADHFIKVLECQLGCEGNLSVVYTEPEENFFPEHFHYLQFAYYKTDQIAEAVESTASYLLFHPEDEVMKDNKQIFMRKFNYDDDQFIPRQDAKAYTDRRKKLQEMFQYLQEHFLQEAPDKIFVTTADAQSEPVSREQPESPTTDHLTWMDRYERLGLHLIAKASDLHRPFRFAADGLLKQEQCEEILMLMEDIPVDKKGVQIFTLAHGRESVLKKEENYEASLRLYMRATEVMRHYAQRYYNLSQSLFFKNSTMVCWRQVPDPEVENDCVPQEFGTCDPEAHIKESELVKDEFVTVTYLSTVDDGDVFFLGENVTIDTSLGVKHGRTIGFQSGDRHGLHVPSSPAVPRCTMVNTYTAYRSEQEKDYTDTIEVLQRLDEIRMEKGLKSRAQVMKTFAEMGVRVVKNGTDLQGEERFVADGLATEAECSSLKNMVMSGALVGDGYDRLEAKPSYISPHTEHELFQGLTIYRASKLMHSGVVSTFALKSFLDLSESSRLLVEKYFNLTRPLYFDFTHLVCRTPIDESKERDDLSHPVHADNCLLQPDGSCLKEYPAYVQRDYSALLYLNEDFRGGEFFFAHGNKSEQVSLKPKCGRLVGFNAKEFHGVRAVLSGTRCALALWFTQNPNFKELAHVHARKVLTTLQAKRGGSNDAQRGGNPDATPEGASLESNHAKVDESQDAVEKSGENQDVSLESNEVESKVSSNHAEAKVEDAFGKNGGNQEVSLESNHAEAESERTFERNDGNLESSLEANHAKSDSENVFEKNGEIRKESFRSNQANAQSDDALEKNDKNVDISLERNNADSVSEDTSEVNGGSLDVTFEANDAHSPLVDSFDEEVNLAANHDEAESEVSAEEHDKNLKVSDEDIAESEMSSKKDDKNLGVSDEGSHAGAQSEVIMEKYNENQESNDNEEEDGDKDEDEAKEEL